MLDLICHFHLGSDYQRCSSSLLHLSCNHSDKVSSLKLLQFENKIFTELNKQLNLTSQQKPCCAHACCHLNVLLKIFPNMVAIDPNFQISLSCSSFKQKAPTYENTTSLLWTSPSLSAYFVGWLNAHFSKFAAAFDLLYPNSLMLLHDRQSRTSYAMRQKKKDS